jgi:DNA-directed RNA polymerase subunit RPC12/RpoP
MPKNNSEKHTSNTSINSKSRPFTCPSCGLRLPLKELLAFNKDHVVVCPYCSSTLAPIKTRSFHWGFAFGFIGFLIPAELLKFLFNSSLLAFFGGMLGGLLTILSIALFVKKTTYFKFKHHIYENSPT